jgi:hypothetical protein
VSCELYSGPVDPPRGPPRTHPAKTKAAAKWPPLKEPRGSNSLDQIDLSREIARDFEANFLLANGRFRPDFHGVSSSVFDRLFLLVVYLARHAQKHQSLFANGVQTFRDRERRTVIAFHGVSTFTRGPSAIGMHGLGALKMRCFTQVHAKSGSKNAECTVNRM